MFVYLKNIKILPMLLFKIMYLFVVKIYCSDNSGFISSSRNGQNLYKNVYNNNRFLNKESQKLINIHQSKIYDSFDDYKTFTTIEKSKLCSEQRSGNYLQNTINNENLKHSGQKETTGQLINSNTICKVRGNIMEKKTQQKIRAEDFKRKSSARIEEPISKMLNPSTNIPRNVFGNKVYPKRMIIKKYKNSDVTHIVTKGNNHHIKIRQVKKNPQKGVFISNNKVINISKRLKREFKTIKKSVQKLVLEQSINNIKFKQRKQKFYSDTNFHIGANIVVRTSPEHLQKSYESETVQNIKSAKIKEIKNNKQHSLNDKCCESKVNLNIENTKYNEKSLVTNSHKKYENPAMVTRIYKSTASKEAIGNKKNVLKSKRIENKKLIQLKFYFDTSFDVSAKMIFETPQEKEQEKPKA